MQLQRLWANIRTDLAQREIGKNNQMQQSQEEAEVDSYASYNKYHA
jgi:hypothetical protein